MAHMQNFDPAQLVFAVDHSTHRLHKFLCISRKFLYLTPFPLKGAYVAKLNFPGDQWGICVTLSLCLYVHN